MGWAALIGPMISAAGATQGGATSSQGGTAASQPVGGAQDNQRNQVNIAPVGVNLGAILAPFIGSPQNGGAGWDVPSPMADMGRAYTQQLKPQILQGASIVDDAEQKNYLPLVLIVGGAAILALLVARM